MVEKVWVWGSGEVGRVRWLARGNARGRVKARDRMEGRMGGMVGGLNWCWSRDDGRSWGVEYRFGTRVFGTKPLVHFGIFSFF